MIHPTAVIHPGARVGANCVIGPFAVIDQDVVVGADCQIGPHVYLTGQTILGARNKVHAGCVIGDWAQDIRFGGELTGVVIGSDNVFREHVTIHRSKHQADPTRIGSHNFLMASCHVGHNTSIGDHVIIANGALLAGHVTVRNHVFISGTCLVHQFARIGEFALMQGGSGVSKDLPPYTVASGNNRIVGLNVIGLRRAGFTTEERLELRKLYHHLFRSGLKFRAALELARAKFTSPKSAVLLDFLAEGRRGFCADSGARSQSSDAES
jgi:UDP-N-acetylglucosamine acyltransferase